MDSKELRLLIEAYSEVYVSNQNEIEEEIEQIDEISANLALTASQKADEVRRKASIAGDRETAAKKAQQASRIYSKVGKLRAKERSVKLNKEELDIFDVVLEFLQAEGFAETLEEAEWMMANVIDEEAIGIILGEEQLDEISDRRVQRVVNARNRRFDRSVDSGAPNKEFYQARRSNKLAARRNERTGSNVKVDPILSKEEYMDEAQVANRDPEKYEREQSKKSAPVRGERTPMPPRGDKRREDFEKWYAANVR